MSYNVYQLQTHQNSSSDVTLFSLNMVSRVIGLLRGSNLEVSADECLGFLGNIQNESNQQQFWDNYLRQAIPVIIEFSRPYQ